MNKMGHCLNPRLVTGCDTQIVCMGTELCPTLCDPMDCSPPGSSVQGIFQARILGWVAISSSRGSSLTQGQNSCLLCLLQWEEGFFFFLPVKLLGKPYTQETDLSNTAKILKTELTLESQPKRVRVRTCKVNLNCLIAYYTNELQTFSTGFKQDLKSHYILFKMARIKSRIIQHIKNWEKLDVSQGKRQSVAKNTDVEIKPRF